MCLCLAAFGSRLHLTFAVKRSQPPLTCHSSFAFRPRSHSTLCYLIVLGRCLLAVKEYTFVRLSAVLKRVGSGRFNSILPGKDVRHRHRRTEPRRAYHYP